MFTKFEMSRMFKAQFDRRDKVQRQHDMEKIRLLANDLSHPSLKVHKVECVPDIWDCSLSRGDRLLYEVVDDTLRLWQIGSHKIIDHLNPEQFHDRAQFFAFVLNEFADPDDQPVPPAWSIAEDQPAQSANLYLTIPTAWLRILGVPADYVKKVRTAPGLEAIEAMLELRESVRARLIELATDPMVLKDSDALIYRTTLDKLADYTEGKLKRLMLNLSPDQQRFVDMDLSGAGLLRGCAGSGKTSILIYRAVRLAMDGQRVLLITYNKPLCLALIAYVEELIGSLPDNLEIINVNAWAATYLYNQDKPVSVSPQKKLDDLLRSAIQEVSQNGVDTFGFSFGFLKQEIAEVIKANGLDKEAYLRWNRYGRGRALRPSQRAIVWEVYTRYQQQLEQERAFDWADQTLYALRCLEQSPYENPYDRILVDEAQDLTGAQFRLLQRLVRDDGQGPALFMVGDESQTLYTRGFTWQQVGLRLRGHSFRIRKNFRGTRQIAQAASRLLQHNKLFNDVTEQVDPEASNRLGPKPLLIPYENTDHARKLVCERILSLVEDGTYRLSDFAILCPTNELVSAFVEKCSLLQIPTLEVRGNERERVDLLEEKVKVLTLHSAKGLEFPIVFIAGLEARILPRFNYDTESDETNFELEKARTLLYVGLTRASEMVFLLTPGNSAERSCFIDELGDALQPE